MLFDSLASDLVATPKGTNPSECIGGCTDVFVRDLKLGTTTLVSVNSAGTASGNSVSFGEALSADGRFVLFGSGASDLVANDTNGGPSFDLFVRDLKLGTTTLVSVNSAGIASANSEFPAFFSANGQFVLFDSDASDLVANDSNGSFDVFVRQLR